MTLERHCLVGSSCQKLNGLIQRWLYFHICVFAWRVSRSKFNSSSLQMWRQLLQWLGRLVRSRWNPAINILIKHSLICINFQKIYLDSAVIWQTMGNVWTTFLCNFVLNLWDLFIWPTKIILYATFSASLDSSDLPIVVTNVQKTVFELP